MSEYLIQGDTLTAIADAIRSKLETSDPMLPGDMAGLIESINTGGEYEATFGEVTYTSRGSVSTGGTLLDTGLSAAPEYFIFMTKDVNTLASGVSNGYLDVQQIYISSSYQYYYAIGKTSSGGSCTSYPLGTTSYYHDFGINGSAIILNSSLQGGWSTIYLNKAYVWMALRKVN